MAKRFNIIRNICDEIEKGNVYVTKEGNFVSAEMLTASIKEEFKKYIMKEGADLSVSFNDYYEKALGDYVSAGDILKTLTSDCLIFNLKYDTEKVKLLLNKKYGYTDTDTVNEQRFDEAVDQVIEEYHNQQEPENNSADKEGENNAESKSGGAGVKRNRKNRKAMDK